MPSLPFVCLVKYLKSPWYTSFPAKSYFCPYHSEYHCLASSTWLNA